MGARVNSGKLAQARAAPRSSIGARETMVSVTMATSEWIQFFKEAGIPPGPAVNYAVMFVDNRIQKSMLLDLNKEIMNELGVTVVGDIIAILKHAKVVHRQDMCKAATESVPCSPSPLPVEIRRGPSSAASRMIANSLNRDSPPGTPPRRPDTSTSKISITVSNKMATKSAKAAAALARREEESLTVPAKRRRVTAEMEGKYIINMPKGTPRTRKILEQQQAAKGLHRTSVFDRLGAETKADTTTGSKPTGVFSRLGATPELDEDLAWDSDNDSSSSVLQYAGVLKKLGGATKASPQPALTVKPRPQLSGYNCRPTLRRLALPPRPGVEKKPESLSKVSIIQRLGKAALVPEAQDSQVTSTKSPTVRRILPGPPEPPASQRPPRRRWRRACRDC
uniref:Chromosome 19 open reading frame 47 n=1 Tax=Loxodonta africana TaxID=9785 RepID=G3SVC7_LOXAF